MLVPQVALHKTVKISINLLEVCCNGSVLFFFSGASEPKNMIYMSRLGIWGEGTPFETFDDFLHTIEKRFVFGFKGILHLKMDLVSLLTHFLILWNSEIQTVKN